METIRKNWTTVLGIVIGAIGGYLYWRNIGCSSGTCPITSSPIVSSLYGALIGGLFGGIFKNVNSKKEK